MMNLCTDNRDQSVNRAKLLNSLNELNSLGLQSNDNYDLDLLDSSHPNRNAAQSFVRNVYQEAFNASINHFYPLLLAIHSPNVAHDFTAVAGLRPAVGGQLFLEQYLSCPIDELLNTDRHRIIEIGNLAPSTIGQSRWLIATLNAFMVAAGFSHVVFTAVPKLKNTFRRMGLPLTKLADADASVLPVSERDSWGTYYQSAPEVFVGKLYKARDAFEAVPINNPGLAQLISQANRLGRTFSYGFNYH